MNNTMTELNLPTINLPTINLTKEKIANTVAKLINHELELTLHYLEDRAPEKIINLLSEHITKEITATPPDFGLEAFEYVVFRSIRDLMYKELVLATNDNVDPELLESLYEEIDIFQGKIIGMYELYRSLIEQTE